MRLSHLAPLALSAFGMPLAAQGQTWAVAGQPGPDVDATTITDALALASDGDLILVRQQAAHDPFVVDGLSVTIQGDPNGVVLPDFPVVTPEPSITIRNLSAGQSVIVRDFTVFQLENEAPAFDLRNNAGTIVIDNVFVDFLGGATGFHVEDSASVALTDVFLQVKNLAPSGVGPEEAAGIDALRSNLFVHESLISGPAGYTSFGELPSEGPSDGAPAVRLRGSTLTATGSEIAGGAGGFVLAGCHFGGNGGAGVEVLEDLGVPSLVRTQDGFVVGGTGSFATCGLTSGVAGAPFELLAGTATALPGSARYLSVESLSAPNSSFDASLTGQVGDLAFLVAGSQPLPGLFLAGPNVSLHLLPEIVIPLGVLNTPMETRTLPTPSIPASVEFVGLPLQGLFVGATEAFLTGPTGIVLVD